VLCLATSSNVYSFCEVPYPTPGGLVIDLSPTFGKLYKVTALPDPTTGSPYDYEYTLCGPNKNTNCSNDKPVSICQEWTGGSVNMGSVASIAVLSDGIQVSYENGAAVNQDIRSVLMKIVCDMEIPGVALTSIQNIPGTLKYNAYAKSQYACPICNRCNGHGKCSLSGCICDTGYSGPSCSNLPPATVDPLIVSIASNIVLGVIVVGLVVFIIYRNRMLYTSMKSM